MRLRLSALLFLSALSGCQGTDTPTIVTPVSGLTAGSVTTAVIAAGAVTPNKLSVAYLPLTGGSLSGLVTLTSGLQVTTGAGTGLVLTSDAQGNATWQAPSVGGGGGPLTSCPSGMTLMGKARSTYCIENQYRPAATLLAGRTTCLAAGYNLCTFSQWTVACSNIPWNNNQNTSPPDYSDLQSEWVDDSFADTAADMGATVGGIVGDNGCAAFSDDVPSSTYPFRCCER